LMSRSEPQVLILIALKTAPTIKLGLKKYYRGGEYGRRVLAGRVRKGRKEGNVPRRESLWEILCASSWQTSVEITRNEV